MRARHPVEEIFFVGKGEGVKKIHFGGMRIDLLLRFLISGGGMCTSI